MFSFSTNEKRELLAATSLFVLIELSIVIIPSGLFTQNLFEIVSSINLDTIIFMIILGLLSVPLFLFHELAHKFVAQGYDLSSEFRFFPNMAIFSLFSILMPVKIIAPGVVQSTGRYSIDLEARIAMAGPLVNLMLGGIFLFLSTLFSGNWITLLLLVSKFSFDLALFNLLPFFVLDGAKVLRWHSGVYGVIFCLSISLWILHPFGIFGIFY